MKRSHFSLGRVILILLVCFVSNSIMAQRINIDTLDIDQLKLYRHKAVIMRDVGMIETFSGISIMGTGLIIGSIMGNSDPESSYDELGGGLVMMITGIIGMTITAVGTYTWVIGGSRKAKAEIALKKFDFNTNNSMAVGIGIKVRF